MTKGVSSPLTSHLLNIRLISTAVTIPSTYRQMMMILWYFTSKHIAVIIIYIGSRAEQLIIGRMSIVISRER